MYFGYRARYIRLLGLHDARLLNQVICGAIKSTWKTPYKVESEYRLCQNTIHAYAVKLRKEKRETISSSILQALFITIFSHFSVYTSDLDQIIGKEARDDEKELNKKKVRF